MGYAVKEVYYTLQGEGYHSGRPAVFLRFSGCNLWSGREEDRESAICRFCDTDFFGTDGPGGGMFERAEDLARHAASVWDSVASGEEDARTFSKESEASLSRRFIVCTGGEPLLQLDVGLVRALHDAGFEIAIETNGTIVPPPDIDWICVSPKSDAPLVLTTGNEMKLVFPQNGAPPDLYDELNFSHFYLQPMDGMDLSANTQTAIEYCLKYPRWKLSLQVHKLLGLR